VLDFRVVVRFARELIARFDVRARPTSRRASSGGNQQTGAGAEFSQSPHVIVANKPTRGLDIGAAAYIQQLLDQRGAGILLVSADLDGFLAERPYSVMFNGRSMGVLDRRTASTTNWG
jgi:simple sugar transport system ATP-binding protein